MMRSKGIGGDTRVEVCQQGSSTRAWDDMHRICSNNHENCTTGDIKQDLSGNVYEQPDA